MSLGKKGLMWDGVWKDGLSSPVKLMITTRWAQQEATEDKTSKQWKITKWRYKTEMQLIGSDGSGSHYWLKRNTSSPPQKRHTCLERRMLLQFCLIFCIKFVIFFCHLASWLDCETRNSSTDSGSWSLNFVLL